ncbi:MAG: alpha/beta hydrolase [Alphaproteobacteria bacterium]|nr:alpha/beta hydrolase [Alphaproteobacteria bacterium]
MNKKLFTTKDGVRLAYFDGAVPGSKIGLVIVHGLAEHKGRYEEFIDRLNAADISTFAPDLRGHGESSGARACVPSFQNYLSDLDEFVRHIKMAHPKLKIGLFGHSMGGLIAAAYAGQSKLIDALILSSPALQRRRILLPLYIFPNCILGKIRISKFWSESKKMMNVARRDPLSSMKFTMRLVKESFLKGVNLADVNIKNISVPVLMMGGSGDIIVNGLDNEFKKFCGRDKTLKIYAKAIHRVVQNAAKDEAIPDIIDWLSDNA